MIAFFCWFFLYLAAGTVISALALPVWVTAVVTVLYTAALGVWLCRKGACRAWFTAPRTDTWTAILPLFVFAIANLLFLKGIAFSATLVCVAVGAVAEELLFRGLLVAALKKRSVHLAVWVSAVIFGAYHLFSGGYVGALCALCFGYALAAYVCRFRSLLPCVLAHLVTNLCGGGDPPLFVKLACCVIAVIYGFVLCKGKKET